MNIGTFKKTFGESFNRMRENERISGVAMEEICKCKMYISDLDSLLQNISQISPETWNYLEYIDSSYIKNLKDSMCFHIVNALSLKQNIQEILFFLTNFFCSFSSSLPDFSIREFTSIVLEYAKCDNSSISSLSLEVISILSKSQINFKNAMFENGIIEVLFRTISSLETAQSTLHVLQSLGPFDRLNIFAEAVLSYLDSLTEDVLIELENFISKGNEEIFESYEQIFNIDSYETRTLKAYLHLFQRVLEDPLTTSYVDSDDFYTKMIDISSNHSELNSDILSCIIYACVDSPERVEKGIEAGIIDFINESIDNGSLQERVLGSVLISVMMVYADTIDTETVLESGILVKVFSNYEDFESFFSFIIENIQKSIENELECEGRQIQNYINKNEEIWRVLEVISSEDTDFSIIAQKILDEISPD